MAKVKDLLVRIVGDDADLEKALKNSERNLDAVGRRAERVGRDLTLKFTAPLVAAGAVAVKFGADYDAVMTQVITLTGAAEDQVALWRRSLLEMGPAVGKGPQELARALLATLSAGAPVAQALDIVERSAKASAVGLGDTAVVAKVVTAALQAYSAQGLTAARATDILVAGVREGAAEAPEFAGALGRVLGQAAQLGVTFEQVVAFIATFTRLGVNADEAVTALVGTLATVQSPSAEAQKALQGMGLSVNDLRRSIVERGLTQTLIDLVQRARQTGTEIASIVPNVRALAGVLGTAGVQGQQFLEVTDNIARSAGTLDAAFERVSRTPAFTFAQLRANIEAVAIAIGEGLAPAVNELLQAMLPTLSVLRTLDPETIRAAAGIALLAAAIPPLIFGIGAAYRTVATLAAGINLLRGGLIAAGAALAPGAAVAAGLGLLAVLLVRSRVEAVRTGIALAQFKSELLALSQVQLAQFGIAKALELDDVIRQLETAKQKVDELARQPQRFERTPAGIDVVTKPEGLDQAERDVERLTAAQHRLEAELTAVNDVQRQNAAITAQSAEEQAKARAEAERLLAELELMGTTAEDAGKKLREPGKILEELEQKLAIANRLGALSDAFDTSELSISAYESALKELSEQLEETDPRVQGVAERLNTLRAAVGGQAVVLADINEELAAAAALGQVAGDSFDEQTLKVGIYEQALQKLIEGGLAPTDPAVREVAAALAVVREEMKLSAESAKKLSEVQAFLNEILAASRTPAEVFVATMQMADFAVQHAGLSMEEYTRILLEARERFDETNEAAKAAGETWEGQVAASIIGAATRIRGSIGSMAASILRDLAAITARLLVMKGLMLLLGSFGIGAASGGILGSIFKIVAAPFGGGKAAGGPVSVGTIYRVNEFGTELFQPSMPGRIQAAGAGPTTTTADPNALANEIFARLGPPPQPMSPREVALDKWWRDFMDEGLKAASASRSPYVNRP